MRSKLFILLALFFAPALFAQPGTALNIPKASLIQPAELNSLIQKNALGQTLLLSTGPHMLYAQAHIPGAEFIGNNPDAIKARVASLKKSQPIILYCGCCPWGHCPTVGPAFETLHSLGFTNVRVLYLENNFGTDWVNKGFATTH